MRTKVIEAHPIADQLMVKCSCGWRKPVSVWDHDSRVELWQAAHKAFDDHECKPA